MRSRIVVAALVALSMLAPGCLQGETSDVDDAGLDPEGDTVRLRAAEANHAFTGAIAAGAGTPLLSIIVLPDSFHDLRFPSDLQEGEIVLEWDVANAPAGLRLHILRGDETQHMEQSVTSPLVIGLGEDDARVRGATGLIVWPANPGAVAALEYNLDVHLQYMEEVAEAPDEEEEDEEEEHRHEDSEA